MKQNYIQGSLFEEDYLLRTLGSLGNSPEVALTELVANAWDAGATQVDIFIPDKIGDKITVTDNGIGLSQENFYSRWMKLGYNRIKHQGKQVNFPSGVDLQRHAYGRNGVGRHGLLCFNSEYTVITNNEGKSSKFIITTKSEKEPFFIKEQSFGKSTSAGTKLEVVVEKNLPNADVILEVISARFLHDPNFTVSINKQTIQLEDHKGLLLSGKVKSGNIDLDIYLIDSKKSRKSTTYQGIAIWQGGRLVGEPSWILGTIPVLDGRSKEAKRYSVVVKTNDLSDFILEDWTGFKRTTQLKPVFEEIDNAVQKMFSNIAKDNLDETTKQIRKDYQRQYNDLSPLAKYEFNEAIEHIAITNPTARQESIALAMETVLNLEKTRSGTELLNKLSTLSQQDVEGLNRLLDNWTVKDALTVLDEIDKRISVIEAIRKLSGDSTVDELQILHPLVASARWIFGPEFDSPEYSSNNQLHKTVEKVFGKKIDKQLFINYKKRPDIVAVGQSTFSVTGTTEHDSDGLAVTKRILIIELKRGGFKIGRDERNQAVGYVEDFLGCGTLLGSPYINAFVVGDEYSEKVQPIQTIKNDEKEVGKVQICLFSQIVDSAEKRLFDLRKHLNERYADVPGIELAGRQEKLAV